MTTARLIFRTPDAPWLPPGSEAEVWAGGVNSLPQPTIIVRLLVTRRSDQGRSNFFCVPSAKGLDLPTRFLNPEHERLHPLSAAAQLLGEVLGSEDVGMRCVGYVRNVVPIPDANYKHPTPFAHVAVLALESSADPIVTGEWVDLETARDSLTPRHWWPIVEHHLSAPGS